MSEGFQLSSDTAVERFVGLNQILPSQYYDLSGGHRLTGEQRLMLALLADAINVYQQGVLSRNTRKRLLFIDAERWITGGATMPPRIQLRHRVRRAGNQPEYAAAPDADVEA